MVDSQATNKSLARTTNKRLCGGAGGKVFVTPTSKLDGSFGSCHHCLREG